MKRVICALFLHFTVTYGMVFDSRCGSMSKASLFGEFCYQFNDSLTTWDDARIRCQQDGGDLLSITSEKEDIYIDYHVRSGTLQNFWIGANDLKSEGEWKWSNGDLFSYFNWNSGEPNNEKEEDCSAIMARFGYKWNDTPCNLRMGYICKKKGLAWDARCGFMVEGNLFEGFCYQFNFNKTTWVEARSKCQAVGGDLLSITSSNEQLYIDGRLRSGKLLDYWIGANDLETEGVWRWSNSDPYVYLNWNSGEPNNDKEEDCSALMARFGYKWNDMPCNLRMGYICKKKGLEDPSSDVTEATTKIGLEDPSSDVTTATPKIEALGIYLGVGQIVVIIVGSVGALVIFGVFICAYVHCRRRHIPQVRQEPYVQSTVPGNNDLVYESAEMDCYKSLNS